MKRKNILWGWAVLVVAMICCWAFSSCGDDKEKDEPKNPLMGAWEYQKNPQVLAQLEAMIVELQQEGALTPYNLEALQRIEDIIATGKFVVCFNEDGEVRLYFYGEDGLGIFVSGTWQPTDNAVLLQVCDLTLALTNITIDGDTLNCTISDLPLSFKRYRN